MTDSLIPLALAARLRAYAPYSNYFVGAAIATDAGVFSGCNVENASYGLCNCAERTAVFSAIAAGARTVMAVVVATRNGGSPCGACRQVLAEFADPSCPVACVDETGTLVLETTVGALLPHAFTPRNLAH
ncbi:cytidine deaminase [Armatimonas rosea]|uniref:Cytidine deaminase n=1 Tax=Armatimonas rosea TaxID=685828 RepID=A0A7W9W8H0_ARMRO|nr:cytidine deaminase [Armatimonas rosea]MBB6052246.1 cytidine deaminase [Armatimonas rosea]